MGGVFVISLDFEMMWGVIDHADVDGYGQSHVAQVPIVIDRLLELFDRYDIHATIAPVGLMMHHDVKDALNHIPSIVPTYSHANLSPYSDSYIAKILPEHEHLYFVPQLIEKLKAQPNIEIGTHTYCHYYCQAEGQTIDQFIADLDKVIEVSREHGIEPHSIIFPRNEVNADYLAVCKERGISIYRGNARKYFEPVSGRWARLRQRLCRLLDGYMNYGGYSTFTLDELRPSNGLVNVPASRFMRPYSRSLKWLESIRISRIKCEITYAASHGELYHLWWHPHNFGLNVAENCAVLEQVLQHFADCRDKYGMKSLTMSETAAIIKK